MKKEKKERKRKRKKKEKKDSIYTKANNALEKRKNQT